MATKRTADELETATSRPRQRTKRTKLSPSAEERSDSSEPSTRSVSEDSALQSSPPGSEHARQSSMSSLDPYSYEDISIASRTPSSEYVTDPEDARDADADAEDEDEDIVTIGAPQKPQMTHSTAVEGAQDLRSRLDALLPRLAAANELLAGEKDARTIEDVEEGEAHIEMNLGLGVLEDKTGEVDGSSSGSEDDTDESDASVAGDEDAPLSSGAIRPEDRETDVMGKLLKRPMSQRKPAIEDLS